MICPPIRTALALFAIAAPTSAQVLDTTGVSDTFSTLLNPRFKTFAHSSSDPNDADVAPSYGNDDGFSGTNQIEAYREFEGIYEYAVLTHQEGRPGYVSSFFRNFWGGLTGAGMLPWENTRAQMLFEDHVLFDMPLENYFRSPGSGQIAPFDGPFTQSRAGGHITYAPMMWENSFKIRVQENWFANAARFHRVTGVLGTWDDVLTMPDRGSWESVQSAVGSWPHATTRTPVQNVLVIPGSGGSQTINLVGPATLLEFTATVSDVAHWDGLVARFTFDGALSPQVDIPLRLLGAMMRQPFSQPVSTLLMNNNGNDRITCYFPMHFTTSATLEIVNNNASKGSTVTVDHCVGTGAHPGDWGYFHATYDAGTTVTGVAFAGASIPDVHGIMRFIGVETSINNFGTIPGIVNLQHIEGDLCVRINGNKGDEHEYAATETSVGHWGWYDSPSDVPFDSDCSFHTGLQTHIPSKKLFETDRMMGTTLVFDPVHYVDGIDIVLEHGTSNHENAIYQLFSFHYIKPGQARDLVQELDVGDTVDEAAQFATFTEAAPMYSPTNGFFRDSQYGDAPVTDSVRVIDTHYSFQVADPSLTTYDAFCIGVRLERDRPGEGDVVQADVYVDGVWAGLLHNATSNQWFKWKEGAELEVELPRSLTAGKTSFSVELRPRGKSAAVNLARIWVYGY